MRKRKTTKIVGTDLLEHPANQAWLQLHSGNEKPDCIEVLKGSNPRQMGRTVRYVCRLVIAGPTRSTVIAKRSLRTDAEIEQTVYEEILRHLPISSLGYYGTVEEANGEYCWLFLEDAGRETYSVRLAEHQILMAQWLGQMHAFTTRITAASCLPNRGPNHYRRRLKSAREAIRCHVDNHALQNDDLVTLEAILHRCDLLESHWDQVEALCMGVPETLVHGDLAARNLAVRAGRSGLILLPFDWAEAGWGVPATDIRFAGATDYLSAVQDYWPQLDLQTVQRVALAGKIFRFLDAIYWEQRSLEYTWLSTPLDNMRIYESRVADAIGAAEFET